MTKISLYKVSYLKGLLEISIKIEMSHELLNEVWWLLISFVVAEK